MVVIKVKNHYQKPSLVFPLLCFVNNFVFLREHKGMIRRQKKLTGLCAACKYTSTAKYDMFEKGYSMILVIEGECESNF